MFDLWRYFLKILIITLIHLLISIANKTHLINGVGAVVARSETQSQPFWLWVDHYSGNRYVEISTTNLDNLKGLAIAERRSLRGTMSQLLPEESAFAN